MGGEVWEEGWIGRTGTGGALHGDTDLVGKSFGEAGRKGIGVYTEVPEETRVQEEERDIAAASVVNDSTFLKGDTVMAAAASTSIMCHTKKAAG